MHNQHIKIAHDIRLDASPRCGSRHLCGRYVFKTPKREGVVDNNKFKDQAYFKRGLAKQKIGDTVGCCKDFKTAFEKGNLEAYHYIKKYCEKQ